MIAQKEKAVKMATVTPKMKLIISRRKKLKLSKI